MVGQAGTRTNCYKGCPGSNAMPMVVATHLGLDKIACYFMLVV